MVNAKVHKFPGKKVVFPFFLFSLSVSLQRRSFLSCVWIRHATLFYDLGRVLIARVKWIQCNWSLRILFNSSLHLFFFNSTFTIGLIESSSYSPHIPPTSSQHTGCNVQLLLSLFFSLALAFTLSLSLSLSQILKSYELNNLFPYINSIL